MVILTSCAITPEEEDREELTPALKYLESPKNVSVISDCVNGRIEVSWEEVPNATHYIVEYQSATDYLSDKPMKTYATNSNSFTLSTFPNSNDKRFVFKVRAVSKQSSRILESDYSNLIEGAIVDDFTVNPIIKGSKLSFFTSFPKIASILNQGDILNCEILFFDGDYTQSDIPDITEAKTTFDIGSSETKTITAVLLSNGKVIKMKSVSVTADVSYIPASLESFTVENNKTDGIHLNWTSPGINKGLENTQILFLVERALINTSNWEIIKPSIDEEYYKPADNDNLTLEHFSMSIIDTTAQPNCDYTYRVSTVYKITNGDNVYYSSESISDKNVVSNCYRADSKVKSFKLTNDSGLIDNEDGSKSHTVKFQWELYHDLSDDCSIVINRKLINTLSSSELESDYNKEFLDQTGNVFEDMITIPSGDYRDPKNFIYTAYIKYNDGTNTDSPYVATYNNNNEQAIIKFEGLSVVNIIKSLSATNGANAINDKIKLTWEVESVFETGFDKEKVTYNIYQQNKADMTYSLIKSGLDFNTRSCDVDVNPGESYSYLIKPVYTQADTTALDYKYVREYPTTGPVVGSALSLVSNLKASQNTFNDKIEVNWSGVENAKAYKVCYLDKEEATTDTNYTIKDIPVEQYGTEITITVKVVDCEDTSSEGGTSTIGKILGGIIPTVKGNAKDIDVTWDAVEGATKYQVKVYTSSTATDPVISEYISAGSNLSFKLNSDDVLNIDGLENPLSRSYYFSVIPYVGGEVSLAENKIEGHWLLAPKNVTATKAAYKDMVQISWESNENATGYNVYYKDKGEQEWKLLSYSSINHINDIRVYGVREYSVSSICRDIEGPLQKSSLLNSENQYNTNVGYPIMTPTQLSGVDLGNNIVAISFKPVLDVTSYIINLNGKEIEILTSQVEEATSIETPTVGTISKDEYGTVTCYLNREVVYESVESIVSVKAKNINAPLESNNSSKKAEVSFLYNNLLPEEIVNILFNCISASVKSANSHFEDDWWQSSLQEYSYSSSAKFATCNGSKIVLGTAKYNPETNGQCVYTDFIKEECKINGNLEMKVKANQSGGYLDGDPLERINGELKVELPYLYGTATVTFSDYYVTNGNGVNNGGDVSVNGVSVSNYSNIKQRIL